MRSVLGLVSVATTLAVSAVACAPPAREPVALATDGPLDGVRMSLPHDRFALPNGLEVIVAPDSSAAEVAVHVRYHAGSRDDAEGRGQTAHLVEHLTFASLRGLPLDDVLPLLERSGALGANGSTSPDSTDYYARIRPEGLERVLWIERQRMHAALEGVTAEVFAREKALIRDEMRLRRSPWWSVAPRVAAEAVYPRTHPYARVFEADEASIARLELEADALPFYKRHYAPNNATLVLAGRVDRGRARALAERWFGDLPPGPAHAGQELAEVRVAGPRRIERTAPVKRPTVVVAWPMPPAHTLEAEAARAAFRGAPQGIVDAVGSPAHYIGGDAWAWELGGVAALWLEVEGDGSLSRLADRTEQALDAAVVPEHHARAYRTTEIADLLFDLDHVQWRARLLADARAGDPVAARFDLLRGVVDAEVDAALRDRLRRRDRRVVVLLHPVKEDAR